MSILGLGAKVLVTYAADTSDIKAKIRELSGEEKLEQERLKAAEGENARLNKQVKALGLVAAGIAATAVAVSLAKKGLDEYAKTSAAAAAEVKKIKDSTSNAMDSVQASIGKTVASMEPLISGVARFVTLLSDAGAMGPLAIGALGLAITGNPAIAAILALGAAGGFDDVSSYITNPQAALAAQKAKAAKGAQGALDGVRNFRTPDAVDPWASGASAWDRVGALIGRGATRFMEKRQPAKAARPETEWLALLREHGVIVGAGGREGNVMEPYKGYSRDSARWQQSYDLKEGFDNQASDRRVSLSGGSGTHQGVEDRYKDWQANKAGSSNKSRLESMFGPLEEFNAYKAAFDALSGAASAAMSAWIDGSMSAGEAFKRFIGESLKAVASQMLVESLKHAAFAIGSAAFGDMGGAGKHAAAAVAFGAGAVIAGGAAKVLGSGGSGGGRPSAPAYSGPNKEGYEGRGGVTIVYGDQFADDSPRNRQRTARKLVGQALGTSGGTYS
jgi:hypothetical protein